MSWHTGPLALFDLETTGVDPHRDRIVPPDSARALAEAGQKAGVQPRVLIQVNTGAEPQKAGVLPDEADALIAAARRLGLNLVGCMAIPPDDADPLPHFRALAAIAKRNDLPGLSMGMSGDYETAIRCGATHVRVGTALFGERNRPETPSSS